MHLGRRLLGAAGTLAVLTMLIAAPAQPAGAAAPAPASSAHGWLRFAHFANGTAPVRVGIDGAVLDPAAAFETVTPYRAVAPGPHVVAISQGATTSLRETVTVAAGQAVTASAVAEPSGLRLVWFRDDLAAAPEGHAKVRVVNVERADTLAAKFRVDGAAADAAPVASTILGSAAAAYAHASPYLAVPAGQYVVSVVDTAGNSVVVGSHWPVVAGTVASLVVLPTKTGATLEVVSDAAGSAATPAGGMATGFGGLAGARSPDHARDLTLTLALASGALAVALAGGYWFGRRSRRSAATLLAATATAVAVVAAAAVWNPPVRSVASAVPISPPPSTAPAVRVAANVDLDHARATAAQRPDRLQIPSLGVDGPLIDLGMNADHTAQVPPDAQQMGWFAEGPAPGQPGPAVILGHVDSRNGPGVFAHLRDLRLGAEIDVWSGAQLNRFRVERVQTVAKRAFPTAAVFGPTPDRELRLVTCGGTFDRAIGHYDDNVIVYAVEVADA